MIPTSVRDSNVEVAYPCRIFERLRKSRAMFYHEINMTYHPWRGVAFYETSRFINELEKLKSLLNKRRFTKVEKSFKYLEDNGPICYVEVFDGRIHNDNCIRVYVVISEKYGIGVSTGIFFPNGNPVIVEPISKLDDLIKSCKKDYSDYNLLMNGM